MWAERRNITLNFIQPGKPQQNAYIERYNRTVRYDWLVQHLFYSLSELQEYVTRLEKAPQGAFSLLLFDGQYSKLVVPGSLLIVI